MTPPLTADRLHGNWATLMLPINDDDSIDYGRLGNELDALVAAGVDGLYTNGTAGEFHTQSEAEFDAIHALVAERCHAAGLPFQIGASHMSAQLSLDRIRRAKALQPAAFQVILADWFPLKEAEMASCLERFAAAADPIPLVLYNPPHAKVVLTPAQVGRLHAAVPALIGVKVADGDDAWYAEMRAHCQGLAVFVPGHHLATGVANGAAGAYSNVACLSPAGAQRWTDQMRTDLPAALELEQRIRRFMDAEIAPFITRDGYANPALDKLLAAIGGWADVGTRLRWPYRWIDPAVADRIRPIAQSMLPELFS
ncbi:MAG TPA: dihydrodipicolinate synthase family protein [Caldilinea sp.]|nr:dihydrodipicolinate synthase family protein [Caldilinea sp.]